MNNIIYLKDMKYKSIDEIVELYRNGYRLEPYPKTLQICPDGCSPSGGLKASYIAGLSFGGFIGFIAGAFLFSH